MKYRILLLLSILSISLFSFVGAMAQGGNASGMLQPPVTEKKPKVTEINGDRLVDNYFWLREKTNPAVITHLEAENAYAAAVMKPTEAFQETLYNEMLSHIKQTDDERALSPRQLFLLLAHRCREAVSDLLPQARQSRCDRRDRCSI